MERLSIIDIATVKMNFKTMFSLKILQTLFIVICGFQLYMYYSLPYSIRNLLSSLSIIFLLLISYKQIFKKNCNVYYRIMQWMFFSWTICMLDAWLFWGQDLSFGYRASSYFLFLIFFYFIANKFKVMELEQLIVILGWLYIVLWLYAITKIPNVTFGYSSQGDIDDESRGFFRVNFTGRLSMIFAYFLYLCKYQVYKKNKYLIYASILCWFVVLQLTRQLILWTGIVTLVYIFLSDKKKAILFSLIFAFLFIGSTQIVFSNDTILGSLINLTNEQSKYAGEDIRIIEYRYFFTKWSPNLFTDIFGTGIPLGGGTAYGNYEEMLKWKHKLFLSDVGYGMMFAVTGALGLILYLWLFFKCTFVKMPKELRYVNLFMGAMIPMNIAAAWYVTADTQICIAICAYLAYKYGDVKGLSAINKN